MGKPRRFAPIRVKVPRNGPDSAKAFQRMDMSDTSRPSIDEVDLLLANARLRDELEPFRDESIDNSSTTRMPLRTENEYLASMLAWERAPVLPLSQWFQPELTLPHPDTLQDDQLHALLWQTIDH